MAEAKRNLFLLIKELDKKLSESKEFADRASLYARLRDSAFDDDFSQLVGLDEIGQQLGLLWLSTSFRSSDRAVPLAIWRGKNAESKRIFFDWVLSTDFCNSGFAEPMNVLLYSGAERRIPLALTNNFLVKVYTESGASEYPIFETGPANFDSQIELFLQNQVSQQNTLQGLGALVRSHCELIFKNTLVNTGNIIRLWKSLDHKTDLNKTEAEKIGFDLAKAVIWNHLVDDSPSAGNWFSKILYIPETLSNELYSSGIICAIPPESETKEGDIVDFLSIFCNRLFAPCYYCYHVVATSYANTKSAIGSIMSRNGSHNIGSHVLAALTHNVGTMPDDRILYQYIQHRMDYVAQVCTEFPVWTQATMFIGEMMRNFLSQYHLLEHIAESEGLHAYRFQDSGMDPEELKGQTRTIKFFVRRLQKDASSQSSSAQSFSIIFDNADNTWHVKNLLSPDQKDIGFDQDIALAIPGGVVGQHAFFTILENIVRNAAKHGWSARNRGGVESLEKNLEIYVDFIADDSKDDVDFIIWDNMSDVFAPLKDENNEWKKHDVIQLLICMVRAHQLENEKGNKPDYLNEALEREKPYHVLLKRLAAINQQSQGPQYFCLDEVTSGNEAVQDDAGKIGDVEADLINAMSYNKKSMIDIRHYLDPVELQVIRQAMEKAKKRGSFLPLPLHWLQQVRLETPFIDDQSGELRKENWGLAEMKISAGYLQRRKMGEIGGLEASPWNPLEAPPWNPIITPIPMAGLCRHHENSNGNLACTKTEPPHPDDLNCPRKQHREHLGYRFKVPKPKEILIVLEDGENPGSGPTFVADCRKQSLYFARRTGADFYIILPNGKPAQKPIEDFNFEYVVLDSLDNPLYAEIKQGDKLRFPFRLLTRYDNCESGQEMIPLCNLDELNNVSAIKCAVYNSWLTHLRNRVQNDEKKTQIATSSWPDGSPLSIALKTDKGSSGGGLVSEDDIWRYVFRHQLCSLIDRFLGLEMNTPLSSFFAQLRKDFLSFNNESDWLDRKSSSSTLATDNLFVQFERDLYAAYDTATTMLQRDGEKVITLPEGFARTGGSSATGACETGLAICLTDVDASSTDILYNRHGGSVQKIYSEGLSGSQSYLNRLIQLQENPKNGSALLMKMAENALMQVLIVDERMSNFFRGREYLIPTFSRMNIWTLDVNGGLTQPDEPNSTLSGADHETKTRLSFDREKLKEAMAKLSVAFSKKQKEEDFQRSGSKVIECLEGIKYKFDILIIHQGLLDKWLDEKMKTPEGVDFFLDHLKKYFHYVVVTTGRGKPANIPPDARVIPFPCIESFLFQQYPEKLLLIDTIMNLLPYGGRQNE